MSIWHEPSEKIERHGNVVYLRNSSIQSIFTCPGPNTGHLVHGLPWCYESDLVAMLHDMRKTEKEPAREKSDDLFFRDRKPCSCGAPVDSVFLTGNGDSLTWLHCSRCRKWTTGQKSIARAVAEWNELVSKSSSAGNAKPTWTGTEKSATGSTKAEWFALESIQFDKDGAPKVNVKKCILEHIDGKLKYSEVETVNELKATSFTSPASIPVDISTRQKVFATGKWADASPEFHVPDGFYAGKPLTTEEDIAARNLLLKTQAEHLKAHLDKVEGEITAMPSAFTVSPDPLAGFGNKCSSDPKNGYQVPDLAPDHVVIPPQTGTITGEAKAASALDRQVGGRHYKSLAIQPVEYIEKNKIPYTEGCVIKYVTRHREKGGADDLKKAIHFIEMLLEREYPKAATAAG